MGAITALPRRKDQMLPAFHAAQDELGWLPRAAIEAVAAHIRVPESEVYASATAYSELRLERPQEGTWGVCTGVACDLAGANGLLEAAPGHARPIDCQFLCALAPVAVDPDEAPHGRVAPDDLRAKASAS